MASQLQTIVLDFEAALLVGIRSGADESALAKIRDKAFDRLRDIKEGPAAPPLESIFEVAGEIGIKLDMALETIKQ